MEPGEREVAEPEESEGGRVRRPVVPSRSHRKSEPDKSSGSDRAEPVCRQRQRVKAEEDSSEERKAEGVKEREMKKGGERGMRAARAWVVAEAPDTAVL